MSDVARCWRLAWEAMIGAGGSVDVTWRSPIIEEDWWTPSTTIGII